MANVPTTRSRAKAVEARIALFVPAGVTVTGLQATVMQNITEIIASAAHNIAGQIEEIDGYDTGRLIATMDALIHVESIAHSAIKLAVPPKPASAATK